VATIYHLAKEHGWRDDASQFIDAVDATRSKSSISPPDPELAATFVRLAALPPVGYDRVRESDAEKLGIRRSTLDEEVEKYKIVPGSAFRMIFTAQHFGTRRKFITSRSHKY
jgi:hypothetical protein